MSHENSTLTTPLLTADDETTNNADRKSQTRLSSSWPLLWRLLCGCILFVLCGAVFSGFSALKPVLYDAGLYSDLCLGNTTTSPCDAQTARINLIFQTTAAGVNGLCLVIGVLSDKLSRRTAALSSSVVLLAGLAGLGIVLADRALDLVWWWVPIALFLAITLAGGLFFFTMLKYATDYPRWSSQIYALLTACWDLSAVVFYLFQVGYFYLHLSLFWLFCGWAALLSIPLIIFSVFIDLPQTTAPVLGPAPLVVDDSDNSTGRQDQPTLLAELKQPKYWAALIWMSAAVLQFYFFMSTVYDQALWLTGGDENAARQLNTVFSVMLPALGFGTNFLFGWLVKNLPRSIGLLMLASTVFAVCSGIESVWLQVVTYFFMITYRIFSFILFYAYVGKHVAPAHYGTLTCLALSVAGAVAFSSAGWNHLVLYSFRGSFLIVNQLLLCFQLIAAVPFLLCAILYDTKQGRTPVAGQDSLNQ